VAERTEAWNAAAQEPLSTAFNLLFINHFPRAGFVRDETLRGSLLPGASS
jgi:hypothetical protein